MVLAGLGVASATALTFNGSITGGECLSILTPVVTGGIGLLAFHAGAQVSGGGAAGNPPTLPASPRQQKP